MGHPAGRTSSRSATGVGGANLPMLLPEVKYAVRETSFAEAREIAAQALAQTTSEGGRAVLTLRGLETAHNNGWDVTNLVHDAIANRWSGCVIDEQRQPNPRRPCQQQREGESEHIAEQSPA